MDYTAARLALCATTLVLAAGVFDIDLRVPLETAVLCHYEEFSPKCPSGHVVVIRSALYGRMALGRCVMTNFGFVGCSSDVTSILSRKCSGRYACAVTVGDPAFGGPPPCHKDFKSYLSVKYSCVRAPELVSPECHLTVSATEPQVVVRHLATKARCGLGRPLVITAEKRQRIQVTLMEFSWKHNISSPSTRIEYVGDNGGEIHPVVPPSGECTRFGTVAEMSGAEVSVRRDICGRRAAVHEAYTSSSHSISVTFSWDETLNFALVFKAVGCPYPEMTDNMRVIAHADSDSAHIGVGCKDSSQVWRLECINGIWIGQIGNCSFAGSGAVAPSGGSFFSGAGDIGPVWTAVTVLGVAVMIGCSILVAGLACWTRMRRKGERRLAHDTMEADDAIQPDIALFQTRPCSGAECTPLYDVYNPKPHHQSGRLNGNYCDTFTTITRPQQTCVFCQAQSDYYVPFARRPDCLLVDSPEGGTGEVRACASLGTLAADPRANKHSLDSAAFPCLTQTERDENSINSATLANKNYLDSHKEEGGSPTIKYSPIPKNVTDDERQYFTH